MNKSLEEKRKTWLTSEWMTQIEWYEVHDFKSDPINVNKNNSALFKQFNFMGFPHQLNCLKNSTGSLEKMWRELNFYQLIQWAY